jgi:hypothetical protein
MTGRPLRRLQELAPGLGEGWRSVASDEGGESVGRAVKVQEMLISWYSGWRLDTTAGSHEANGLIGGELGGGLDAGNRARPFLSPTLRLQPAVLGDR